MKRHRFSNWLLVIVFSAGAVVSTKPSLVGDLLSHLDSRFISVQSDVTGVLLSDIIDGVLPYNGQIAIELNGNKPVFEQPLFDQEPFVSLSELDSLGRSGQALAIISPETMPTEARGEMGLLRPAGWHTIRYDDLIEDKYLYNRCHIIGYQLCGINSDPRDIFTGTRYLNVEGMLPYENMVASYVRRYKAPVLYRVTPIYIDAGLVPYGVQMEACSIKDNGKSICFNVFVYNIQPGIEIDYFTGDSWVK